MRNFSELTAVLKPTDLILLNPCGHGLPLVGERVALKSGSTENTNRPRACSVAGAEL